MAAISIIRAVCRSISRSLNVKVSVKNALIKTFMTYLQPRQLQYILPDSNTAFERWDNKQSTIETRPKPRIDILPDGMSKLFWIGDPKLSSSVILFFHGGGYVLPLSQGHFEWAAHFRRVGLMANKQICSALLDYSLCPGETYPRQMRQASLALEHLLSIGYSPSQVIVGGDSAGGHLALSLLSHLMYSYPGEAFPVLKLSEKLAGCFLVSPLLSLELDTASYKDNLHADLLSVPVIRDWGEDLFRHSRFKIEKQNRKGWGMALSGDENWWARLNQVVKRVYLVGGGEELFRDDIIKFGVILQGIEGLDSCCHINWKEAHDSTFMDYESGVYPSRSTIRLADWVVETLELSH